jgi:hypothetical protein
MSSPALKNLQKRALVDTSISQHEQALLHDNRNRQKVLEGMPQDPKPHEIVPGKDDCSQDNAHALFQHNGPPIINNFFANLEIESSKYQTRRRDGVIREQRRPQVPVAVRTPPTELWRPKKNQPISGDQQNATETWTQHYPSSTLWFNERSDNQSPSIPPPSSIRGVPPQSVPSGSNALGGPRLNTDKTKLGMPTTQLSPPRAG